MKNILILVLSLFTIISCKPDDYVEPPMLDIDVTVTFCDDRPDRIIHTKSDEYVNGCGCTGSSSKSGQRYHKNINNNKAVPEWNGLLNVCEVKFDTLQVSTLIKA